MVQAVVRLRESEPLTGFVTTARVGAVSCYLVTIASSVKKKKNRTHFLIEVIIQCGGDTCCVVVPTELVTITVCTESGL